MKLRGAQTEKPPTVGWRYLIARLANCWHIFLIRTKPKPHGTLPIVAYNPEQGSVQVNGNGANGDAKNESKQKSISLNLHWKTFAVGIIAGSLLCIGLFFLSASHLKQISTGDTKNHIGESATVVGVVSEIHITPKGTVLIDMDGRFPNEQFTAVWFGPSAPVAQLQYFDGKTISVKGTIQEYRGRPEIILTSMNQISD